jgi:hypothetical protein
MPVRWNRYDVPEESTTRLIVRTFGTELLEGAGYWHAGAGDDIVSSIVQVRVWAGKRSGERRPLDIE